MTWQTPSYGGIEGFDFFSPQTTNVTCGLDPKPWQGLSSFDVGLFPDLLDFSSQDFTMPVTPVGSSKRSYGEQCPEEDIQTRKKLRTPNTSTMSGHSQSLDARLQPKQIAPKPQIQCEDEDKGEHPFACPFYKNNPKKYGANRKRKCSSQNWNIHRLKEHLFRTHLKKVYRCDRCLTEVTALTDLSAHRRSSNEPCPLVANSNNVGIDYIDLDQKSQIRNRLRERPDQEKWMEIYRIIFRLSPDDDQIPSPFFETHHNSSSSSPSPHPRSHHPHDPTQEDPSSSLEAFKDWLREKQKDKKGIGGNHDVDDHVMDKTSSQGVGGGLEDVVLDLVGDFEVEMKAAGVGAGKKEDGR